MTNVMQIRSAALCIRFSDTERAVLAEAAAVSGETSSAFVRRAAVSIARSMLRAAQDVRHEVEA